MNKQFQVAQASGAGNSNSAAPARIFVLTKPLADQSVVINLGYEQKVKVDFSGVAQEKITLVHIGEKLIVLFDNQSTVTIEPFFDSRHDALGNLTIEVSPGRELSVTEFASAFPITTDSSVLPAAGTDGNVQASGAHFEPSPFDPLPPIPTNILAPPEELPVLAFTNPTSDAIPTNPTPPPPPPPPVNPVTILAGIGQPLEVGESFIPGVGSQLAFSAVKHSNSDTANFASSFTVTAPAGVQSITYALTLPSNGIDTGLIDTGTGNHLFLFVEGGQIVAREGLTLAQAINGPIDATLAVDAAGNVSFTAFRSVHEFTLSPNVLEGISPNGGLVSLIATVTGNDGSTANASIDIGPLITIHDDVPHIAAFASGPAMSVDESFLAAATNGIDGSAPNAANTHATGDFSNAFIHLNGADGATIAYSLNITGGNGTPSGLFDAQTGLSDVLVLNGNTVEGHVGSIGGALAFTIALDPATGIVTLTEDRSVKQGSPDTPTDISEGISLNSVANLVTLTATITDGDGDTATASIDLGKQISFLDDGPSIQLAVLGEEQQLPTLVVDESFLPNGSTPSPALTVSTGDFHGAFTHVDGADGATIAYTLGVSAPGVDSDLIDSLSGQHVLLTVNGSGVVEGRTAVGGDLVFTLAVDSSGVVTLSDFRAVHEGTTGENPDQSESISLNSVANLVTLTATITDADGDHQSANIDLGKQVFFLDDGPSVSAVTSGVTAALDEGNTDVGSPPTSTAATISTGIIVKGDDPDVAGTGYISHAISAGSLVSPASTFGADGPGSAVYALTVDNATSGLFVTDGSAITLQLVGGVVVGVVAAGAFAGQAAFAIAIDSATGVVTVEQYLSLHQDSLANTPDDAVSMLAGRLGIDVTATDADNDQATAHVDVSAQITFDDDGPSVSAVTSGVTAALDEGNTDVGSPPTSTAATISTGIIVKGDDPDVAGTGYISHAISAGSLVTPTAAFGADGPATSGSTAYALSVTNATSGLFVTDGSAITLQLVGGVVVGVVAAGAFAGQAAFAIAIDGTTGVVTVEQYLSLHQDSLATTPDDAVSMLAGHLGITVTITDGDGDKAVSNVVDVSTQITFDDDGPKVTAVTSGVTAALDEGNTDVGSPPTSTAATISTGIIVKGDDPDVAGTGYISHAISAGSLVTPTAAFGADGPATSGSTAYALSVTNATSGLFVTDGSAITLQLVGGVVVGVVAAGAFAGQAAFAIAIDGTTGVVTVEQYLSLHQDSLATTPDDAVSMLAGHLGITVTITDGDGDQAVSNVVDVSTQITFDDDGPKVTAVTSGVTAALDEGNTDVGSPPTSTAATISTGIIVKGDDPDVAGTGYISHAISAGSLVTPTAAFGADGPATSGSTAYALSVTNATSGLFVTDGSAITLQLVGGVVVGVVAAGAFAGQAAFAIAIDGATGVVTVEQYLSLHQDSLATTPDDAVSMLAGHLGITVTITDGDGDKAVSNVVDVSTQITFDDDGPKITAVTSGVTAALDEGNTDVGSPPTSTAATISTGIIVKGDDPDVAGTGYISHAISAGSLVTPTAAFGADGPATSGSTAYALSVTNATSGLFVTDGSAITLQLVGGVVVGVVAAGAFAGQAAFAIAIDGATGVVTVEQYLSLHQDSLATTPDDAVSMLAGHLGITVTITDGDGDKAVSNVVDVSTQITFDDDGPKITAVTSGVTAALDEGNTDVGSPPTSTAATISTGIIVKGDDPDVAGTGYISHAISAGSLVTPTAAFGADGPATSGSTAYALSVTNATSGLFVTDGSAITLQLVGGVVVGVVAAGAFAGQAAFAIAIDGATGVVTVEQYLSLHQDSLATTPDDAVSMLAGHLGITVTITDGDGDQAVSNVVDVSTQITFDDDGPKVTAVTSGVTAALDEGNTDVGSPPTSTAATISTGIIVKGDDPDVAGTGYISHAISAGSLVTPTAAFGADGPATSGSTAYALSVTNATSGLFVTDGSAITLQLVGGVVVGVVAAGAFAGQAAFAIAIDGTTGVVTVEQYLSLHQDSLATTPDDAVSMLAGHLGITVTITDGDGDKAVSNVVDVSTQITFDDDGPKITAVTSGVTAALDEGNTDVGSPPTSTAATISTGIIVKGDDPDVAGTGYISHAISAGSLVTPTAAFGADGPATSGSTAYALSVTNATSGLFVTDGSAITLQLVGGVVVGVVAAGAFAGQAAFAIAIDGATGVVTVEQYLSLHQDSLTTTPDDAVSMLAGHLGITVTITDGDGDQAVSNVVDVSTQITFDDDGPTIGAIQNAIMPSVNNTDAHGTWQPAFGADGPSTTTGIAITMGAAPAGESYVITDTLTHNPAGEEIFSVKVTAGSKSYTFYEYTHYDAATHTGEMFAYGSLADAQAGLGNNEFFTLSMAADGTYDFHLVSNSLQTFAAFDFTTLPPGNSDYATITNGVFTEHSGSDSIAGTSILIDGFDTTHLDPNSGNKPFINNGAGGGLGLNNGNLNTNETIFFQFNTDPADPAFVGLQSSVTIGIGKGNNSTNESFQITIWDATHTTSATETITQPDGTPIIVDSTHWTGAPGTFFNFAEIDVKNIGGTAGFTTSDDKVLITSISGATTIGSTTLTFAPVITDGDGDTAHASTDLSVALNGTANAAGGYDLTGSNALAEVLVASVGTDHLNGGTGPGDTIDYSNSNAGVTVDLGANTVSGGWAALDTISNFENVIGSAFADTLTGGTGSNTLTGGAGADHFVYNATTDGLDNIVDFAPGSDVLDFKSSAFGNLATGTLNAANFESNTTGVGTHAGPEFIYNTTSHVLSFDSDGTGAAVAIQMAHLENGVPLAAANVHIVA